MTMKFTNNASADLASSITAGATSLTVAAGFGALFPSLGAGDYFFATLINPQNELEVVRVTGRTGDTFTIVRGQDGTVARAYVAGSKVELRPTAAGLSEFAQLSDNQTFTGVNTFTQQIVASGGVQGNVTGNVTGNAGTVTNGVYTTGDQTIGGVKTFSSRVNGKTSGTDATPAFSAATTGGLYATMWTRRGAPFHTTAATTGSSYAPALSHVYAHNSGWDGIYSVGVLNLDAASPGAFVIHHINSSAGQDYSWQFYGSNGDFVSPGNVTAYSDVRLKADLTKISEALAKVNQLNGYTYTRKDSGERQTGVVAQEVQAVLPEAVLDNGETLAVAYGNMVGLLIEAIKEQDAIVEQMGDRIEQLESTVLKLIKDLDARVGSLEVR